MPAAPSDLLFLSSGLLSDAQAQLRELAIISTDENKIDTLLKLREQIDVRQQRIMRANLKEIDHDPLVLGTVNQLTDIAGELAAAVREMRTITQAIRTANKIMSTADRLLTLSKFI